MQEKRPIKNGKTDIHLESCLQQEVTAVISVPLNQHVEGSALTSDHITELISSLRDNIRSPDRKQLTTNLLELRAKLQAAAVSPNSLQMVLFSFQDAVGLETRFPPLPQGHLSGSWSV